MIIDKEIRLRKGLKTDAIAKRAGLNKRLVEKAFLGLSVSKENYDKIVNAVGELVDEFSASQ